MTHIQHLMSGWTAENKTKLFNKMQRLGISQGGILSTTQENLELFNYLMNEMKGV